MLMGIHQNQIDAKNRLIIPAKFREELGAQCVLTRGLDECLILYPMTTWREQQAKLAELPRSDEKARAFLRYIYANASECEVDKQGRILLPAEYRQMAGIVKETVTIGMLDRVELWAREIYDNSENGGKLKPSDFAGFTDTYRV